MRDAILLHGAPSKEEYYDDAYPSLSNSHWFPWLQKQLLIHDILTQTPEMPQAYTPQYNLWENEFKRYRITKESILVGHSCGGGFLLRWLSENIINIDKLILVAPWLDPNKERTTDFFDFIIDPNIEKRCTQLHIFISKDDDQDILDSFETITFSLQNTTIHSYENKGHFTYSDMHAYEFVDLRDAIIN